MPSVTIAAGTLEYRTLGPADSEFPAAVFVHGFLVDSTLWDPVARQLAEHGVRSVLVDWPLGSHRTSMNADADMSPIGVARMVNQVLDVLGLTDVTLVGNDTGGAICQLLLADDASRIGRVVLTNCDAFENFPPKVFVPLFHIAKHPLLVKMMLAPTRLRVIRHSPLAYGLLLRSPRDAALTRRWIAPSLTDRAIRDDIARFTRALDRKALVHIAPALRNFRGPARIVWGTADRCFTLATARRLAEAFADARLLEVPGSTTFVSIDAPDTVTAAILDLAHGSLDGDALDAART
jgi:pimeloyl-ACP methyl ester carboxylesterase